VRQARDCRVAGRPSVSDPDIEVMLSEVESARQLADLGRRAGAICFMAWLALSADLNAQTDRLVLTESSRYVMAADAQVYGGALSPGGGQSLFWDDDAVWIASDDQSNARPVCPGIVRAPLGAAFVSDGSRAGSVAIEIVDRGGGEDIAPQLVRSVAGQCMIESWSVLEPSRPLTHAAGLWAFVSEMLSTPRAKLRTNRVTLSRTDGRTARQTAMDLTASWSDSFAVVLSGTSRVVVLSSRLFPFSWIATDETSRSTVGGAVPTSNELFYSYDAWVGTGVFALDAGFVQVLADLESDRRHLITYDSVGAFRRRTVLDVPFGILHTLPDRRELLALRRTDRLEILTYRWSWQSDRAKDEPNPRSEP